MSTQGVGTFAINSFWESGRLIFYEKAYGHTTTGNVFILGADYVQVGDTANDVNFVWDGTTTGTFTLDAGAHTLAMTGLATSTDGAVTITNATATSSTTTGALIVTGGIATAADITCGDDLSMASSGAIINFNSGDVTLTHSSGKLTLGGDGAVTLDLDGASMDVDLPAGCVDKADLASEVYTIEHICLTGNTNDFDSETVILSKLWSAGTIVRVNYFTNAALGTSLGIDIVDGGTAGSGSDVIDSCADNLNGSDSNTLSTPYAMSAGDYINVTFDDVTNDVSFTIDIQVKVPVAAAT